MDFFDYLKQQKQKVDQDMEYMDAMSEPSVMDQYIKENDPEQWNKIEQARNRKFALEAGMQGGPTMGTIKPPGFKGIFQVLKGGKDTGPTAEEALSTGVKRIIKDAYPENISDAEKKMIDLLRKDPSIPTVDKQEALKKRFKLLDTIKKDE